MVNLKAKLQKAREGAELDKHNRRVLDHLEQLDTQEVGGSGGVATLSVWHCWTWLHILAR